MRLWTRNCALGVAAVLALAPAAAAQTADPPNPLKTVKALKCHFPVAVSGTWKNGEAVATPRTQELLINVTEIDVSDGTAEVAGTAGKAFVSAVLSGWSLYFVENGVGQLNVTTVFAQESVPGKLKAVHSRHGYLQMQVGKFISEPSVSQNYGECEIVPG
ncbi:MAG TPA: hypothetical protein VGQ37_18970 [Vicinamibacterales bacterium]|jgi:uncharacterized lipoprotein YbaY|nr:hypothetical protein [Vicinamibacterales bacterium]